MIVINIGGGPGSGKTTLAYYLTYKFKTKGIRTEFVGEAAREEHIYDAAPEVVAPPLLDNQILLAGQQYERLKRLQRHKFQVAVSDSPLLQGILYCSNPSHREYLSYFLSNLQNEFQNINIFAHRMAGVYDPESRIQKTEVEATAFDRQVEKLMSWDLHSHWGGEEKLSWAIGLLMEEKYDFTYKA